MIWCLWNLTFNLHFQKHNTGPIKVIIKIIPQTSIYANECSEGINIHVMPCVLFSNTIFQVHKQIQISYRHIVVQYIPLNIHMVLLCFVMFCVVILSDLLDIIWSIYPHLSWLLHWHWGNRMIAPVPVKEPWRIWIKPNHNNQNKARTGCKILGMYCI